MKLVYVVNARIPTEKAHGLQVSKMCQSFKSLGNEVHLIISDRVNNHPKDLFSFYGIKERFQVTYLPISRFGTPRTVFGSRIIEFSFINSLRKFSRELSADVVITRDIFFVLFFGRRYQSFYELHDFPERFLWMWRIMLSRAAGVIVTNKWKKDAVVTKLDVPQKKILIAPNGFDPHIFYSSLENSHVSRRSLGLKNTDLVLCYTGSLKTMSMDKGISWLIESLAMLPNSVNLLFVGGAIEDIEEYKRSIQEEEIKRRVHFVSRVPHTQMASYMNLADILVAPFPDTPHFRYYMSPIKLFEYLATGKPIVATNLPTIAEIISDAGMLFEPDDQNQFVEYIKLLSKDFDLRKKLSDAALTRSKGFTWDKRAKKILHFIAKDV